MRADQRIQLEYNEYTGAAEQKRGWQTDAAVDIERQVAVIPPIGMKPFFQHPRGQILHNGAADHGNEKYLPDL